MDPLRSKTARRFPTCQLALTVLAATALPGLASGETAPQSVGASAYADVTGASNAAPTATVKKGFGGDLTATWSGSALESADRDRVSTLDLELAPWIALGHSLRADAYVSATRDMNGYQESKMTDGRLGILREPVALSRVFKARPKMTVYLPVEPEKREVNSFIGALGASGRVLFEKDVLSGYYQIGLTRNFYSYTTTGKGESNPEWSLGHALKTDLRLGALTLDLTGLLTTKRTFEGTPSSTFEVSEELDWGLGAWTVGVGHTNGASLYQANGADSNFSFANGNTSKFYANANYSF
jgi:hypothetical protein